MSRRGQQEMQFNWIFALVGGFLFLLFFFILIRSITSGADERDARQLSYAVVTIVTSSASNPEAFTVANLQDASYRFVCERDDAGIRSYVQVDSEDYQDQDLRHVPVFSPAVVKGDQLFTLARTWEAPFPVGTFVLASNNRTRYVIAGPMSKPKAFIDEENLGGFNVYPVGVAALGGVKDEGFDRYRIVVLDYAGTQNSFPTTLDATIKKPKNTGLVIHFTPDGEAGTLDFYNDLSDVTNPAKQKKNIPFYGRAMADAAIFSQDNETFSCNMVKAYERLNSTIEILDRRLSDILLLQQYTSTTPCGLIYTGAKTQLGAYRLQTHDALISASSRPDPRGPIVKIRSANDQEAPAADCPAIY